MNATLNLTIPAAVQPGVVVQPIPMCLQEYAVNTALRLSWVLLALTIFMIFYFGRARPYVRLLVEKSLSRNGGFPPGGPAQTDKILRTIDHALLVVAAGLAAVITEALRHAV